MAVSRESRLIVGCCVCVMQERNYTAMQEFVDRLPCAQRYCSDALAVYQELWWPDDSVHVISQRKEETFMIESLNADLRTYLGMRAAGAEATLKMLLAVLGGTCPCYPYVHMALQQTQTPHLTPAQVS